MPALLRAQSRRLVSLNDGATYVGVHARTLRRYVAAGRITAYRVGPRLIKVDLAELDAQLLDRISAGGAVA